MQYRASTEIDATAEQVWEALVDVGTWHEWDPHVELVDGEVVEGGAVTVHTTLSDRAFPVTVSELVPNERMVWSSGMPLGLFKGARTFTLEESDGTTTYTAHEVFSGPLVKLIGRTMPDLQPSFDGHVAGLKARVESG